MTWAAVGSLTPGLEPPVGVDGELVDLARAGDGRVSLRAVDLIGTRGGGGPSFAMLMGEFLTMPVTDRGPLLLLLVIVLVPGAVALAAFSPCASFM